MMTFSTAGVVDELPWFDFRAYDWSLARRLVPEGCGRGCPLGSVFRRLTDDTTNVCIDAGGKSHRHESYRIACGQAGKGGSGDRFDGGCQFARSQGDFAQRVAAGRDDPGVDSRVSFYGCSAGSVLLRAGGRKVWSGVGVCCGQRAVGDDSAGDLAAVLVCRAGDRAVSVCEVRGLSVDS